MLVRVKPPLCVSADVHTEAVQAALAKHKERKMAVPMPSKRRSLVVQTSMDAYTPPGKENTVTATLRGHVDVGPSVVFGSLVCDGLLPRKGQNPEESNSRIPACH